MQSVGRRDETGIDKRAGGASSNEAADSTVSEIAFMPIHMPL